MMKKTLTLLILIAVVGFAAWMVFPRAEKHMLSGEPNGEGQYVHTEEGEFYSIVVQLPAHTPLSGPADEKARLIMEKVFADAIAQFKKDSNAEGITLETEPWMEGRKYQYAAAYAEFVSDDTVSYRFDIYVDTGGAHPNGTYQTFVFDKEGAEQILDDVVAHPDDRGLLVQLSEAATTQVRAQAIERAGPEAAETLFTEGLAPKEENFRNFVVDGNLLRIFIPPYQAAAYAFGPFEVVVPLK